MSSRDVDRSAYQARLADVCPLGERQVSYIPPGWWESHLIGPGLKVALDDYRKAAEVVSHIAGPRGVDYIELWDLWVASNEAGPLPSKTARWRGANQHKVIDAGYLEDIRAHYDPVPDWALPRYVGR